MRSLDRRSGLGPAPTARRLEHGELSRSDLLALGFIVIAVLVTTALHPSPSRPVAVLALQALAVALVARWSTHTALAGHLHAFFPIVIVVSLFETMGLIIAASTSARFDAALASIDARVFGALISHWRAALGRPDWLTDLASLAYASFYPFPIAVAIGLYRRPEGADFELFSTCIVATFLASYVGYFFWPALGPRVPVEAEAQLLGGGELSSLLRAVLRFVEGNQLDAFPSGHAAVATTTLVLGWPRFPRARPAMLLVFGGILFATVYLSLHYAVDLVAGMALGVVVTAAVARSGSQRRGRRQ